MSEQPQPQQPSQPSQPQQGASKPVSPEAWAAWFRQTQGREPSFAEYRQAISSGQVSDQGQEKQGQSNFGAAAAQGAQQMADGAKQVVTGLRDLYSNKVSPAVQKAYADSKAGGNPVEIASRIAPIAQAVAALLGIIALFLPVVSVSIFGFNRSMNFFADELGGEGTFLLVFMLAVIVLSGVQVAKEARWSRITSSVVTLIVSVFGLLDGLGNIARFGEIGVAPGFGLVLLAIVAVLLLAAAVFNLLGLRKSTPARQAAATAVPGYPQGQPGQAATPAATAVQPQQHGAPQAQAPAQPVAPQMPQQQAQPQVPAQPAAQPQQPQAPVHPAQPAAQPQAPAQQPAAQAPQAPAEGQQPQAPQQ